MKKNQLSLAVAATAAGLASAAYADMYVNADGSGEALIFPFYSAQSNNQTYVNVINTTSHYKAVKVRVREGQAGEETADLNVYMGPRDYFSFGIVADDDSDGARIVSGDSTCTVPSIGDLQNALFSDETRETIGTIEVIEMGQIDAAGPVAGWIASGDCESLTSAWGSDGAWTADAATGFAASWSGGGLIGTATVVNSEAGTGVGFDAAAVADMVSAGSSGSALHYAPSADGPTFSDASIAGDVAALFKVKDLANDYTTETALAALTDWVVAMPFGNDACKNVTLSVYNRSGDSPDVTPPASINLCDTVNVVHFGGASATKSSSNLVNASGYRADTGADANGSAIMDLTGEDASGLPAVGFSVVQYTNGTLQDSDGNSILANYQQAWEHKTLVTSS